MQIHYLEIVTKEVDAVCAAYAATFGLHFGDPDAGLGNARTLLDEVELVLLLAVNPGFPGQRFAATTPRRLELVRERVSAAGRDILVGVDGGVTRENLSEIAGLGPDLIVTGSAVFDGRAPAENARGMLEALARLRRSAP